MWPHDGTLLPLMKEWWENMNEEGTTGYFFPNKLKNLKEKVVDWRNNVFGEIEK